MVSSIYSMRRFILVLLFLLLTPVFSKVIISSPKNGAIINRGVIDVFGVTDESGDITLSIYEPLTGVETFSGVASPDSNGFWNYSIDVSGFNGSSIYLIANSILDKSNALLNLKNYLILDLIVGNSSFRRGDIISIKADIIGVNGSAGIDSIPLKFNDSVDSLTAYLDKEDDFYAGSYELPARARLSSWRAWVNYSSELFRIVSDVEFFKVMPTTIELDLLSDRYSSLGLYSLEAGAGYANNELFAGNVINATIASPDGESFNVQLNPRGDFFCKELLFNQPGKWLVDLQAGERGNSGFLNTSVIVSDELMIEVVDSSLLAGENISLLVSVEGFDNGSNISFSLSGLPAVISRVVKEGDYYRLILDVDLTVGDYDFTITATDDFGNQGVASSVLRINDLVLNSSISDSFINGSVALSDGTSLPALIELYIDGGLVDSVTSSPQGSFFFNHTLAGDYILVVARYEGLVKSDLFRVNQVNSSNINVGSLLIEFPLLVESNGTQASSLINFSSDYSEPVIVSFNQSSVPDWIFIPDEVMVPSFGASALLTVKPFNISSGAYPLSINGFVGDDSFTEDFVVIVSDDEPVISNLSINSVSFDLNNSGLLIHVSNPDPSSHELLVNSSGNISSVIISAFTDDEVFIPFTGLSRDLSLITGDQVLFSMDDVVSVDSFSNELDYSLVIFLLVIGYPIIIISFLGWLYSDNIRLFFRRKLKK